MWRCRLLGHRFRFTSEAATMRWSCDRGCGVGGSRRYDSPKRAARYARALDAGNGGELGRNAPLIGLFPLRLVRALRRGRTRA